MPDYNVSRICGIIPALSRDEVLAIHAACNEQLMRMRQEGVVTSSVTHLLSNRSGASIFIWSACGARVLKRRQTARHTELIPQVTCRACKRTLQYREGSQV